MDLTTAVSSGILLGGALGHLVLSGEHGGLLDGLELLVVALGSLLHLLVEFGLKGASLFGLALGDLGDLLGHALVVSAGLVLDGADLHLALLLGSL